MITIYGRAEPLNYALKSAVNMTQEPGGGKILLVDGESELQLNRFV